MGIYQRKKCSEQQNSNFISRESSSEKTSPCTAKDNSPSLTSVEIQLQRAQQGFNFANVDITPSPKAFPQPIQRKVEVSPAHDKYEQEADRVADRVVKSINTPQNNSVQQKPSNQSQSSPHQLSVREYVTTRAIQARQEENVGRPFDMTKNKFINYSVVQKRPDIDIDVKPMQIPPHRIQRRSDFTQGGVVNSQFEQNLTRAKTGGQPLDRQLQRKMGNAIGADFSPIRIHQDNRADHLSRSIQAKAFTTGNHIFFKKGEYNPSSQSGQKLIAHELTHTVQQGGAIQRKPTETSKEEQNIPTITPQRMDTTQRASETIQRAVGLEIEVPIPVDNLSPEQVGILEYKVKYYQKIAQEYDSFTKEFNKKDQYLSWYTSLPKKIQIKKQRDKWTEQRNTANSKMMQKSQEYTDSRSDITGFIRECGRAGYGSALDKQDEGFRIDVDHDDRVQGSSREFPPVEVGGDSIMEIVTYPAETKDDLNKIMDNVDKYLKKIMSQTNNLTRRHPVSNYERIQGIGPFVYPEKKLWWQSWFNSSGKKDRHNLKGSIQANVGIDLRQYNQLIDWYGSNDISKAPTTEDDRSQKMYRDITEQMKQAAKLAREITSQFLSQIVIPEEKSLSKNKNNFDERDVGNFAGFEGWVTHMVLYLRRGMVSGIGGNPKNVVPVLLKTPNEIAAEYGMTGIEKLYWNDYHRSITEIILQAIGRKDETKKELREILIFPEKYKENNEHDSDVTWLTDLKKKRPLLTSTPIDKPTGVGPRRKGTKKESELPSVDSDYVGGGEDTRGGMVVEFRNIPGLHDGVESWRQIGLEFFSQADKLNQTSKSQPKLDETSSSQQNMTFLDDDEYKQKYSLSSNDDNDYKRRDSLSMNENEIVINNIVDLTSLEPDDNAHEPHEVSSEEIDTDEQDREMAREWFNEWGGDGHNPELLDLLYDYCQDPSTIDIPEYVYNESIFLDEIKRLYQKNRSIFEVGNKPGEMQTDNTNELTQDVIDENEENIPLLHRNS